MDPNPHAATLMAATIRFETLIQGGVLDDPAVLHRLRLDLMRAANDFLRVEQEQTGRASDAPGHRARRETFSYFHGLRQRHSGHIGDWTPRRVAAEWPRYRQESEALIAQLRGVMDRRATAMAQR